MGLCAISRFYVTHDPIIYVKDWIGGGVTVFSE